MVDTVIQQEIMSSYEAPKNTSVGHIHLKVSDLDRAIDFYNRVLGFAITARMGDSAAFLSAGGYHHHIGLNTWKSKGGQPPGPGTTGLFHVAFLYETRRDLAVVVKRLLDLGIPLDGAADHGVSEAIYLRDPDQNGIELYWDRPKTDWPKNSDGEIEMYTKELDLAGLLSLA